jgi:Protein of unknown function (DUF664)
LTLPAGDGRQLQDLPDEQLRTSLLPSGWTPLGPLKYLTYVEIHWFVWDFEGAPVDQP